MAHRERLCRYILQQLSIITTVLQFSVTIVIGVVLSRPPSHITRCRVIILGGLDQDMAHCKTLYNYVLQDHHSLRQLLQWLSQYRILNNINSQHRISHGTLRDTMQVHIIVAIHQNYCITIQCDNCDRGSPIHAAKEYYQAPQIKTQIVRHHITMYILQQLYIIPNAV